MKEPHRQSNLGFRFMALEFRVRDRLHPPIEILKTAGVRPGMTLLDFGCGPGGFSIAAAKLVGSKGQVYSVDIHPLALRSVQRAARRSGLSNINTVFGESMAEISEATVDVALLYDVLHGVAEANLVLMRLHRILKPSGMLSVSDHHMKEADMLSLIAGEGLYLLAGRSSTTYEFKKSEKNESGI